MSVLATTATAEGLSSILEGAGVDPDAVELQDIHRSFEEGGKTFRVFALHTDAWQSKIEAAITRGGEEFRWL